MSRIRAVPAVLIVALLLAVNAGCAPEQPPLPPPAPPSLPTILPSTPPPSLNDPVVLRVGTTKSFKTTNKFADYWYGVLSNLTTHDSLIKLGSDMKPAPWLATGWSVSADSMEFTFTITEDATWHDGTPLTADDVKFSIDYYRDRDPQAGWMQEIIETVTVEGDTVTLALSRPYGNLLTEFMTYSMIPAHIWQAVEEPLKYEETDMVIGSGPFRLESWDAAAGKFIFTAHEDHFKGAPNIDRLEVNVYRTMDALVMALANGEIDTWWDYSGEFPYTHVPPLQQSGDIEFASATYLGVPAAIGFNLGTGPASDLPFRQAVAAAINYEQIAQLVFSGYGSTPTAGFVPPTHPNYSAELPPLERDPDKAASLLESLGYVDRDNDGIREDEDGKDLVVNLLTRGDVASTLRTTEMVAADLLAAGIGSTVKAVDNATWIAAKDAMDYDLVFFRATPWGTLMHASHGSGYFDSRRTGAGVLHNLADPGYLAACDARLANADPGQQERLDKQLQQMHANHLPGIALTWIESVYPYHEGWKSWTIDHIYGGVVNSFSWFTVSKD